MLPVRIATTLLIGVSVAVMAVAGDAGDPAKPKGGKQPQPPIVKTPANEIIQEFPSNGEMETAWKVEWDTVTGYGLFIKGAWFKKGPTDRWLQVLGDARISELFVPYHRGNPRFWDVSYDFGLCTVTKDDAGPFGKLLRARPGDPPTVVREIRDRGVIYKDEKHTRRGQALVLWACLEAANYRYIMEYGFQDDGAITFRVGSTGRNFGGAEYEPHMHNGLWRVNVNLDGGPDQPANNSVYLVEHVEPLPQAKAKSRTQITPFNGGKEGWADWNAEKFTTVRVVNDKIKTTQRGVDYVLAYDLMPLRMGNARHFAGPKELCTQHDFWVTRNRPKQLVYTEVPNYVKPGEGVMNTDVVLWHSTPAHHEPRLEDGKMPDGAKGSIQGVTHTMWAGFTLRPRNLFAQTPLYPYSR